MNTKRTNGNQRNRPNKNENVSNNSWTNYANQNGAKEAVMNNRETTRTILVKNLNKQTLPDTIMNYFDKFDSVEDVILNADDGGELDGTATVVFNRPPVNPAGLTKPHRIDGAHVQVEFIRNQAHEPYTNNSEQTIMRAHCLSIGCMKGPKEFVEQWFTTSNIKFIVNYSFRRVQLLFNHLDEEYKIEYHFKDVIDDMYTERKEDNDGRGNRPVIFFTIRLRNPGTFWRRKNNVVLTTATTSKRGKQWERVILIPLKKGQKRPRQRAITPLFPEGFINISDWLVYRLRFSPHRHHVQDFKKQLNEAAKYNLVPQNLDTLRPFIKVTKASDLPKPWSHVERTELDLDYSVLYMLECAISYNFLNEYNLTPEFYAMLKDLDPEISCGILSIIVDGKQHVWDPLAEFRRIFEKMGMKVKNQRKVPSHCAMLRKVIVTPSRMYCNMPSLETTNRVVRHYKEHTEGFLRLQFTDEGFNRVGAGKMNDNRNVIYDRIYHVLKNGIQIGKKRYEFLAFSSSQLREHGCWFFAPTVDLHPDDIRKWMGVFSHEKIVAKHAIRMGQCFSSTIPTYTLQPEDVQTIPDIKRNGFTFSDGVGKISQSLAEEVALRLDLKVVPSAFQFRLGGAKGILTVDDELDKQNVKIQLRPSQTKFESKHLTLEIIRTSTYIHGYLNRQVITLLSSLGIKDEIFMKFMDEMVQDVNKLFQKPEEAVRVLLSNVDEAGTAHSMVSIIQAGFLERGDPYIKNLLNLFRVNVLKDLKKKAKIVVPKGAYLLGVMDETGTLEEGEVFVQICDTSNNGLNKQVITGDVVVFRNPCFHPGDVRVVKAVNRERLAYLQDVIVFSSKGYRDIPSMCSGGDLDGDDYTVYWDPRLIPAKCFTPMDYTAPPSREKDNVQIIDILRFFVNYINNDNLGQIANAHLATADFSPLGARDGKCIRLAQKHSEAVDFPKSGKPADVPADLIVKTFPDFMQKKDKPQYQSQKVLGRIFRAIDKSDYKDYQSTLTAETTYDTRMSVPDMDIYIAEARELRDNYNRSLLALMNQFGVQTEAEAISGYVIKWVKKGDKKSKFEHHDITMKAVNKCKTQMKKEFEGEFLDASKTIDWSKRHLIEAKAAAWYYVTYHPNERKRDTSLEGGFISFPWCIQEYICDIAKKSNTDPSDVKAWMPVPEEKIQEGKLKLFKMRDSEAPIIVDDDDDDDEEDSEEESSSDDSSDDEIVRLPVNNTTTYPLVNLAPTRPRSNNQNTSGIASNFNQRPLEPHQSVIAVDATEDELEQALLGLNL